MTARSTRLSLFVADRNDGFSTAELLTNWQTLDAAPGLFICTSGSRPTDWGANQTGRGIIETDTKLVWYWDGAAFYRRSGTGRVAGSTRSSDFSTPSQTATTVLSVSAAVPAGGRYMMIMATASKVENDVGRCAVSLFRDSTQLYEWEVRGKSSAVATEDQGDGKSFPFFEAPASATYTYALKIRSLSGIAGNSIMRGNGASPIRLDVVEL
jgi:hypothetical protein